MSIEFNRMILQVNHTTGAYSQVCHRSMRVFKYAPGAYLLGEAIYAPGAFVHSNMLLEHI